MGKDKRAFFSVYHKDGIVEMAMRLIKLGYEIVASGGTARHLAENDVAVTNVEAMIQDIYEQKIRRALENNEVLSFDGITATKLSRMLAKSDVFATGPILRHRVVTLRPEVHAGLIFDRSDPTQVQQMKDLMLPEFNLVVVDFYPAETMINKPNADTASVVDLTDVGGPTMVLSAAKGEIPVICRVEDREPTLLELERDGYICMPNIRKLRARAYFEVSRYMAQLAMFHGENEYDIVHAEKAADTCYGENAPQIPAILYRTAKPYENLLGLPEAKQIEGSGPSGNNFTDFSRLLRTITQIGAIFNETITPFIVTGVKHGNSCGVGVSKTSPREAILKAANGDPLAMMGGLWGCNFPINEDLAELLCTVGMPCEVHQKFDGLIAPAADEKALAVFKRRHGKCRVFVNPALGLNLGDSMEKGWRRTPVMGGYIKQPYPKFVFRHGVPNLEIWGRPIDEPQLIDGYIGAAIGSTSNANNIVLVEDGMLYGLGCGQQSRDAACELAIRRSIRVSGRTVGGCVAYSNSFFPFPDGPEILFKAGVRVIFGTRGSINDHLVRKFIEDHDMSMYTVPDKEGRGFFGHVG